jgi:hypothetical protein
MEQRVFYIVIDCRGHHRKGIKYITPIMSTYNKTFGLDEQKMFFELCRKIKTIKIPL